MEQLSRYNSDPQIINMHVIKSVLQYLKETMLFGLIYGKDVAHLIKLYKSYDIIEYVDSNYLSNPKDQKSIMSYYFFINRAIVIWNSKNQHTISTFIKKAKYIELEHKAHEGV